MSGGRRRIVVGVSGSIGSLQALRESARQARACEGEMHAVLAWTVPGSEVVTPGAAPSPAEYWADDACGRLRTAFDQAFGGAPADLSVMLHVVRGHPGSVLVRLADRADDLLVVGTGSGGRIRRMRSGPVTRYCLARATCPLVVVPASELLRECRRRSWRIVPGVRTSHPV